MGVVVGQARGNLTTRSTGRWTARYSDLGLTAPPVSASVRVPARMCTRNIAACRAPALNLRICATIGGGRERRRMLSSEAKTLSLRRLELKCTAGVRSWRCNASVVASLDGSARRARPPALRTVVPLGVGAFDGCRGEAGAREPNYALHRSVDGAALRSGSHRAAGERER